MQNNNNYSDNWQPYLGDYDKFEYDVKLKDGTIVENCYPNAGKFNSISDLHDQQEFEEDLVSEIRFSQNPRFGINEEVSNVAQYEYLDKVENNTIIQERKSKSSISKLISMFAMSEAMFASASIPFVSTYGKSSSKKYNKFGTARRVEVRTEPKIGRNEICPKCQSGLKFKRCCGSAK